MSSTPLIRDHFGERRKWDDWREFQNWQAAQIMNIIFGNGYVEIPRLPKGYEEYATNWFQNQARIAGKDLAWGWDKPFESTIQPQPKGL